MQLPLDICQKYGQVVFQNEQKGIEILRTIEDFIEEYQEESIFYNDSPQSKTVFIERSKEGIVTVVKSVKLLPNIQVNLKALLKALINNEQECLKVLTDLSTMTGLLSPDWIAKVIGTLQFIQFANNLTRVQLTPGHASVLIALHHLSGGEVQLKISLNQLQQRLSLTFEQLDEILEDLEDLHCVSRSQKDIFLIEKVILKDN